MKSHQDLEEEAPRYLRFLQRLVLGGVAATSVPSLGACSEDECEESACDEADADPVDAGVTVDGPLPPPDLPSRPSS